MKEHPVGKHQQIILNLLGRKAATHPHAREIFDSLGIVVHPRRVGRTTEPEVSWKPDRWTNDPETSDQYVAAPRTLTQEQEQAIRDAGYWRD